VKVSKYAIINIIRLNKLKKIDKDEITIVAIIGPLLLNIEIYSFIKPLIKSSDIIPFKIDKRLLLYTFL
jgi:hypothetical protein